MAASNRYECYLNEKDLHFAASKLNKPNTNNDRLEKIDKLRNSLSAKHLQKNLPSPVWIIEISVGEMWDL